METVYLERKTEVIRNKAKLEDKLRVKIELDGRKATISGEPTDEYETAIVFKAINFGFSADKALILKDTEFLFRTIQIKDFTRKKDLTSVKGRIIGKNGKTLNTLHSISGGYVKLKDNEVGIICSGETIEELTTAIQSLIRGTKQSNVYHFLEKMNAGRKDEDLGLKSEKNEEKEE